MWRNNCAARPVRSRQTEPRCVAVAFQDVGADTIPAAAAVIARRLLQNHDD
jgi:hypothetical protein